MDITIIITIIPTTNFKKVFFKTSTVGHMTLCLTSLNESKKNKKTPFNILVRTGGETRTPNHWFWRPPLYQLSYTRIKKNYSTISETLPEPTVRPPSLTANIKPFSNAIGFIKDTSIVI